MNNADLTNAIAEAKRKLPLPALLRHYRIDGDAVKGINSPFRPDSDSGAFGIFHKKDGAWNWKDLVTGDFGDEIDFIEKYENRSREDSIIKFLEMAEVAHPAKKTSAPISRRVSAPAAPAEARPPKSAPAPAPFDWKKCVEAAKSKLAQVADWRGISPEFLEAIRGEGLIGLFQPWLQGANPAVAFPVHADGKVIGCHYRLDAHNAALFTESQKRRGKDWTYKEGDWMYSKGAKTAPLLIGDPKAAADIFIFESQWDALAVADKLGWHTWYEVGRRNVAFVVTRGSGNGALVDGLLNPDARVTVWPQNDKPGKDGTIPAEAWCAAVTEAAKGITLHRVEIPKEHKDANDWVKAGADKAVLQEAIVGARNPKLATLLDREFNFDNPPKKTFPVLWLGDVGIAKPCDLVALSAQVKAGKSSAIGAMMACLISNEGDFLGFRGENQRGHTILHFDTEQSPEDHHYLIMRALRRGNLASPPGFLRSFCFTDLSVDQRKDTVRYALEALPRPFAAVLIDGVADLCRDVNDPEESNALVDTLYKWAIEFHVPVICVLHENPGTTTGKTRGHLGSQLERKAATNLRLEKAADGRIEIFTEKARRGHIAKGTGPCFEWSHNASMHVSCERDAAPPSGRFQQKYQIDDILKQMSVITPIKTPELLRICSEETGISKPNFYRLWSKIKADGLVQISDEGWFKK